MPIALYGLVLSRNAAAAGSAVADARVVVEGPLGAVSREVGRDADRRSASLDDVRAHDALLRRIVTAGVTVVATRFGQVFESEDALRRVVRESDPHIHEVLERYDGAVEMRLLLPELGDLGQEGGSNPSPGGDDASPDAGPGTRYLEAARARLRASAPRVSLRDALGPVVEAERVERLPGRPGSATSGGGGAASVASSGVVFAHLVRQDRVEDYRAAVEAIPALAEARVVGPLALYSFSGGPDD